jgi:hypothetical protein
LVRSVERAEHVTHWEIHSEKKRSADGTAGAVPKRKEVNGTIENSFNGKIDRTQNYDSKSESRAWYCGWSEKERRLDLLQLRIPEFSFPDPVPDLPSSQTIGQRRVGPPPAKRGVVCHSSVFSFSQTRKGKLGAQSLIVPHGFVLPLY